MRHNPGVPTCEPDLEKVAQLVWTAIDDNERRHRHRKITLYCWRIRLAAKFMTFWAIERNLLPRAPRTWLIKRELRKAQSATVQSPVRP